MSTFRFLSVPVRQGSSLWGLLTAKCRIAVALISIASAANSTSGWPPTQEHVVPAGQKQAPPAEQQDTPRHSLFDGQTMKGWEVTEFGGQRPVEVRDQAIVLEAGYPLTGCHWTGDKLPTSNYELQLEAKRIEGNDFFCCVTFPVSDSHCSLVVGGWGGSLVGLSCIDELDASRNETQSIRTFKRDQWYRIRVRVTDARIECWIDDERVVEQAVIGHKFSVRNEVLLSRPLGICTFETTAAIRKIEWTPLSQEPRR